MDDSGLRYLEFVYDGQGRIQEVSDHTGRQVTFSYDGATGDLITSTDVVGETRSYRYDDPALPHYLTEVVDPRGVTVERTEFDAQGRALRQYNGAGELVVELSYHPDGTVTLSDALDNSETHSYDDRNTLTSQTDALGEASTKT
ncbi:MAG: RHS repeat protein, partial [Chloroflexi bacterium]|nr:RHS repeat protein [Chloroflexota bacterium]